MITLRDYRECFATDLRDPEFQWELIAFSYEEEGEIGVVRALKLIAPDRESEICENELRSFSEQETKNAKTNGVTDNAKFAKTNSVLG